MKLAKCTVALILSIAATYGQSIKDVVIPQRDTTESFAPVTISGAVNPYAALGFSSDGTLVALPQLALLGPISFSEDLAPGTPASGKVYIYAKADGLLYSKNDAGVETVVTGGGGGGISDGDKGDIVVSSSGATWTLDPMSAVTYIEVAAPSAPAAGRVVLYAKADGLIYQKDDAGVETVVTGGSTSGVSDADYGAITVSGAGSVWTIDSPHILPEGVAPLTPAAGTVSLYAKADGLLYSKDDAGVETVVTGGGSVSGDVSAAAAFATDNVVIRSDGTAKGVQASAVSVDDSGNMTLGTTGSGTVNIGSAGVRLTDDNDGALTFLGLGGGTNDEDLTLNFDDTANTIVASSSTGVTLFDWGVINLKIPTEAYGVGWSGDATAATKADLYTKIETLGAGSGLGYTLLLNNMNTYNATNGVTYYIGAGLQGSSSAALTWGNSSIDIPKAGTIKRLWIKVQCTAATSSETTQHFIRLNNTSDVAGSQIDLDYDTSTGQSGVAAAINQAVSAGDLISLKVVTPTYTGTPATSIKTHAIVYIE